MSSGFIHCSISRSCRVGFSNTSSTTRCCTRSCPTKPMPLAGAGCTPPNFIDGKKDSRAIAGRGSGKTKISRAFCADSALTSEGRASARPRSLPRAASSLGRAEAQSLRNKFPLTNLRRRRTSIGLRRRGCRCYVLFDEVPERAREQQRGQLRAPVVQDHLLHNCGGAGFRRVVAGKFPA